MRHPRGLQYSPRCEFETAGFPDSGHVVRSRTDRRPDLVRSPPGPVITPAAPPPAALESANVVATSRSQADTLADKVIWTSSSRRPAIPGTCSTSTWTWKPISASTPSSRRRCSPPSARLQHPARRQRETARFPDSGARDRVRYDRRPDLAAPDRRRRNGQLPSGAVRKARLREDPVEERRSWTSSSRRPAIPGTCSTSTWTSKPISASTPSSRRRCSPPSARLQHPARRQRQTARFPDPGARDRVRVRPAAGPGVRRPAPQWPSAPPQPSAQAGPSTSGSRCRSRSKVLAIVAEKTGYPKDMLDLDLDLEADLGIDTVKQAEMFASVRAAFGIPRDQNLQAARLPDAGPRDSVRAGPADARRVQTARTAPLPARPEPSPPSKPPSRVPRRVPVPQLRAAARGVQADRRFARGRQPRRDHARSRRSRRRARPDSTRRRDLGESRVRLDQRKPGRRARCRASTGCRRSTTKATSDRMDLAQWHEALRIRVKSLYPTMRTLYDRIAPRHIPGFGDPSRRTARLRRRRRMSRRSAAPSPASPRPTSASVRMRSSKRSISSRRPNAGG